MSAILFPVEGNPIEIDYTGKVEQIQACVNGYFELINFAIEDVEFEAWINEEGRLLKLPANDFVSDVIGFAYQDRDFMVYGDVLITAPTDDGDSRGLNAYETNLINSMYNARVIAIRLTNLLERFVATPPMHTLN